jgi:hypothetical protein
MKIRVKTVSVMISAKVVGRLSLYIRLGFAELKIWTCRIENLWLIPL